MKILQVYFFFLLVSILFISCSSDDDNQNDDQAQLEPVITAYNTIYRNEHNNNPYIDVVEEFYLGNVTNNRKQNSTAEYYHDGILQGQGSYDYNLYEFDSNNRLQKFTEDLTEDISSRDYYNFYYDNTGQLIGSSWTLTQNSTNYYRFIHPEENISYAEYITLPYNDQNTTILWRNILEFDKNDNVIKAGRDFNLDGIMDYENTFFYDQNNNLISGNFVNEGSFNISYSNIIDTSRFLQDKTFGKKTVRLLSAASFGGNIPNHITDANISYNITVQETTEYEYEVLENNYYRKKIYTFNPFPDIYETISWEYIFE